MPCEGSLQDREYAKFRDGSDGKCVVGVSIIDDLSGSEPGSVPTYDYSSVSSVASSSPTNILSYTVPALKKFDLILVECGGENIATYEVKIGAATIAKKRTYFGGNLFTDFSFQTAPNNGREFSAGQTIIVSVEHFRPSTSSFEARIVGVLRDA